MTPPWGINWQKYHQDQQDLPHIERMGYRAFTIYEWHWSNRDALRDLLAVTRQDAIFLNRDHPKSEEKDDLWKSDPARKGRNHADDWAQKVKEGRVFTPLERTYFLGLNEPDSNVFQRQIDAYNEAYCRRMAEHGLRAAAYSFGVGHPSTVDLRPDTPPDWSWYEASAAAILEGNHLAAFHEYGAPSVGGYGWEFWCNRVAACPYPFDAGLDECGIDNGVVNAGQLYGWAKFMKPEEYLLWLDGFQLGMAQRAPTRKVNLKFYNIFGYDHGSGESKDWHSFDIRPLRPLLEAHQWSVPIDTHLPTIIAPGPTPAEPQEPSMPTGIIEPRVAQAILQVESGGRTHGNDGRLLIRFEVHIFHRYYNDQSAFDAHFLYDRKDYLNVSYRVDPYASWVPVHRSQKTEWEAFEIARKLNANAAYQSISMGAPQVMGFNAQRVGFSSAEAMFNAFQSAQMQTIGFINFFLSDPALMEAARRKDWREIARRYNGSGQVDYYAKVLREAYEALA